MSDLAKKLSDFTKSGFRPIAGRETKQLAAIGRLIVAFSTNVDLVIKGFLQIQLYNVNDPTRRALVGEMRTGDVFATTRRILKAQGVDAKILGELERLSTEISRLRVVRDIVAHRNCWVSGDKLAFHNIFVARSAADIELDIYSIRELYEFSDYAARLGYRLIPFLTSAIQKRMPNLELYMREKIFQAVLEWIMKLAREKKIKGETTKQIQELTAKAHSSLRAYGNTMMEIGKKQAEQEHEANLSMCALFVRLALLDVPTGAALLEIPPRLRNKDHNRPAGISRSRARPPRSSPP